MKYILEQFAKNVAEGPDLPFLYDDAHRGGMSFAEFDDRSGRVYAFLKERGIGREAMVMIRLPRGVMPWIAAVGVWKAGAAFVIVEENYAPERIAFIRKDCGCREEIDVNLFRQMMETRSRAGYEPVAPHDAAFAVYTSGTSGQPKGVLHEYGNLQRCAESLRIEGNILLRGGIFRPYASPQSFVAGVIGLISMLCADHARMYIVPYAVAKDPETFEELFREYGFNMLFLSPSYARVLAPRLQSCLDVLILGSEPANDFFLPGLDIRNFYGSSESLFLVGTFRIDRPYQMAPVGKPSFPLEIRLVDEDGKDVAAGETGEVIYDTPYLRGYINRPEENAAALREGYFHTGDLARRDENGSLVVVGRCTDMVKIHGNRVEPAEIESVFKRLTGASWAAARAFAAEGISGLLCVYYTDRLSFDEDELRRRMEEYLPYYMIPSCFMRVEKIPLRPNGKLDRKALPIPDPRLRRRGFTLPEGWTETALCQGFEKVLGAERIGAEDDFYALGGDSLRSIALVTEAGLPGLSIGMIYRGRTPRRIAALYEQARTAEKTPPEVANREAMKRPQPLTTEQTYMLDSQLYTPNSTMYNVYALLRAGRGSLDAERLAKAVDGAVLSHPALQTVFFFNEDGEMMQRYAPEQFIPTGVTRCSETVFQRLREELVQPHRLLGSHLYRSRVYETESGIYLFLDVHHMVFDGSSLRVLLEDIAAVYDGGKPRLDYYYLLLEKRQQERKGELAEESRRYYERLYGGEKWDAYPHIDHYTRENRAGEIAFSLPVDRETLRAAEERLGVGHNAFFLGASLLAMASYNQSEHVKLSWIFHGREEKETETTVGLLYRDLPVAVRLERISGLSELFEQVRDQVRGGIRHSAFPYVEKAFALEKVTACVLYQRRIYDPITIAGETLTGIEIRQNRDASQTVLDIMILDRAEGLTLRLDYIATLYERASMERFGKRLAWMCREITRAVTEQKDTGIASLMERAAQQDNGTGPG